MENSRMFQFVKNDFMMLQENILQNNICNSFPLYAWITEILFMYEGKIKLLFSKYIIGKKYAKVQLLNRNF